MTTPETRSRLQAVENRLALPTPDPLPGQETIDLPPPMPVQLTLPEPT